MIAGKLRLSFSKIHPLVRITGLYFLFWLLIFNLGRIVFILYQQGKITEERITEQAYAGVSGFKVDLATAAYFVIPVLLFSFFASWGMSRFWGRFCRGFSLLLLALTCIIHIAELPLYTEWNQKLNYKALWFLQNPAEVYHTASATQLFGGIIGIAVFFIVGMSLLRMIPQAEHVNWQTGKRTKHSLVFVLLFFPLLLAARGGWAPIPIQISDAYYSKNPTLNAAASNSVFHLLSNVLQHLEAVEPYRFMENSEAERIVNELYHVEKDSTIQFVTSAKPNVCLVIFEGWTADCIESFGGQEGITPEFDKLVAEGISFDSCYASGNLSDQGMGAIFSAFPAQPRTSIVTVPSKYTALPSLVAPFEKNGYSTSYLFGGQLEYGNIKSYIYHMGFDLVEEENAFDASVYRGRLGVHDGDLFHRKLGQLNRSKQPFFASVFTQSTHGPYDIPVRQTIDWEGDTKGYLNGLHYADSVLGRFMEQAKKQAWYKNTLFVFVSDHHHASTKNTSYYSPEYRRIPLLFYGDVIAPEFRGIVYHRICSQLDLASTLLNQLNFDARRFEWSKDLMNPFSKEFAMYTFDEGFGWKRPEGQLVVHVRDNRVEFERAKNPEELERLKNEGKACLQRLTEQFSAY